MPSTGRASRMTPCSSELTGDSVLYDAGHADKTAPALSGRYIARRAAKLLAGGLQAIYTTHAH